MNQGASQCYPLPLSARKLGWAPLAAVCETHRCQDFLHSSPPFGLGHAHEPEAVLNVLEGGENWY
jgi:hypothetical protein